MAVLRKIIKIDEDLCDGCGACVPSCAEGAIEIIDGKAKLVKDIYCDGLGACMGDCPTGALTLIEREADEFDEEAVHKFLAGKKPAPEAKLSSGCPSESFATVQTPCEMANLPASVNPKGSGSALSHWPVQIRLIPPEAPFLKGANLLVVADCVAVTYPSLQEDFMGQRIVMMGCPKFDDTESYVEKFSDIFKTAGIKTVTILIMEVPCCSKMPGIVEKAIDLSGATIPVEKVVISTKGVILPKKGQDFKLTP